MSVLFSLVAGTRALHVAVQHSQLHWGLVHHVPSGWGTDRGHSFTGMNDMVTKQS